VTLDDAPDLLTVKEAKAILRCGKNQLYAAVRDGEMPAIRVRGAIRIPKRALVAMLNGEAPAAGGRPGQVLDGGHQSGGSRAG
jgi:excisionase family DNA binding protein